MPAAPRPQTATLAGRGMLAMTTGWALALAVNRSLRRVRGGSMAPTLLEDDLVLTLPVLRPHRGQIVLLRDPRNGEHAQVKRVLGLPGESLRSVHGRLLVDGVGLLEPYASGNGPDGALRVPAGHVAVLGDARGASTDSREYGPVPLELVDRWVVARIAPRPRLLVGRGPTMLTVAPRDLSVTPPGTAAS